MASLTAGVQWREAVLSADRGTFTLDWRAVPFHLLVLQCFWPSSTPAFSGYLNVPSWSISCEWFFYLLAPVVMFFALGNRRRWRSEEHTSELQSRLHLVCRLLLEKKNIVNGNALEHPARH